MKNNKIIRACTVAQSAGFFVGLIPELRAKGFEVVAVSSPGKELRQVEEAGGRCVPVEMERHIAPLKDAKSLWRLIRVFRRERPLMVHSMTPKAGLLCMTAAWLTRVPLRVHTFTGLVFPTASGLAKRILMLTDRLTCAFATHIIPEGEGVKSDLLGNGITRKETRVLGHGNCRGIDLERFNPDDSEVATSAKSLRRNDRITFIFVGRIVRDKGINELAEAFARLYAERNDVRLILVGPEERDLDPISERSRKIIESCQGIEAVGSQTDVRPWLAASDIFVFPSYREGFPNVVIEAGAMGLPSIVTDINGSREIILTGKNGVIIPSRDAEALYSAMKDMAENPESRKVMERNARPLIASRYEQGFVRQCLLDFYDEVISGVRKS